MKVGVTTNTDGNTVSQSVSTGPFSWRQVWTRLCRRRWRPLGWPGRSCPPPGDSPRLSVSGQSGGRPPPASPAPPPPAPPWSRSTWCSQPGRSPPSPGLEIQSLQIKYPTFQHSLGNFTLGFHQIIGWRTTGRTNLSCFIFPTSGVGQYYTILSWKPKESKCTFL